MKNHIYFENSFLTVENYPEEKYALLTWKGRLTVEKLKEGLSIVILLFQKEGIFKILSDNRLVKAPSQTEEQYIRDVFYATLSREGLKRMAVVREENIFAKVIIRKILEDKVNVPTKYFDNIEQAKEWIVLDE